MKVKVKMSIGKDLEVEDVITIDDRKVEGLSEEDIEAAVEIRVRKWADERISIEWES